MSNFRFDELMNDLGLSPKGAASERKRDSKNSGRGSRDGFEQRPDLAGSGLGELQSPTPESSASVIRPGDALSELWSAPLA